MATIKGTSAADQLTGTGDADDIQGLGGHDELRGEGGNDTIDGGDGDDAIYGGSGGDLIYGGEGGDFIQTNTGEDTVYGGRGDDRIFGDDPYTAHSGDTFYGEEGNDSLYGHGGDNKLYGGIGDDYLGGEGGADFLDGGDGNDIIHTGGVGIAGQRDIVDAGAGNDRIGFGYVSFVDNQFATAKGGAGNDVYEQVYTPWVTIQEEENGGEDTVLLQWTTDWTIQENIEHVIAYSNEAARITGNGLNNHVTGTNWADNLRGEGGNDTLVGGDRADTLQGGAGDDVLIGTFAHQIGLSDGHADIYVGGLGNDIYHADAGETVTELADEGIDEVVTGSATYTLGANLENLTSIKYYSHADYARTFTGNGLANKITGGALGDQLDGVTGDDSLFGGEGDDTLVAGAGNDSLSGGGGSDTVRLSGVRADYAIIDLGAGRFRIVDNRQGGDGQDIIEGVEQLLFGDGEVVSPKSAATGTNRAPVGTADNYSVGEDGTLVVAQAQGVLANDVEPDGEAMTAGLVTGPAHGALELNGDGSFRYVPNENFAGTDSFTYQATDGASPGQPVTVTINVAAANDAPTAADDGGFVTGFETPLVIEPSALLGNDSDIDGDSLSLVSVQNAVNGSVQLKDGKVIFTPTAGHSGSASYSYTVSDGRGGTDTATATITVEAPPQNSAPTAVGDSYQLAEDGTLNVPVASGILANDSDPDGDPLTAMLIEGTRNGTLTVNADGSFSYAPNSNFSGTDSFTYRANDGSARSAPVTVTINVTPVNDAPLAAANSYTAVENGTLTVAAASGVLANDSDVEGDPLTASIVQGPANGALTLNADGSFSYVPKANFSGTDSFIYRANDGSANSAPTTVTINVTPVNGAPVAVANSYSVNEDGSLSVTAANGVLANDTDPDGDPLTAAVVQGPANGALTLNADGSFAYVPKANFSGTDSFTYRANDGSANSAPTTVTINVTPVNDAPVAVANSYALNEDGTLNVAAASGVLANDSDVDNAQLTASLVSGPTHGTLTMNADGSFVYKPNANFNGTDSFVYRASDGSLSSAPATVTISVAPVNDAPDAVDDGQFQTAYNSAFSRTAAQLLANDSDADGNSLSILSVGNAVNGTVTMQNGVVTFTPSPGFSGNASYSYVLSDGQGATDTATVSIKVGAPTTSGSDGVKTIVNGTAGNDDLSAVRDPDGSDLRGGEKNDILRGGRGDDWLTGGAGDDQIFGGAGADQFRFYGDQIEGTSDTDRVFDLGFGEGDTLVFGGFGAGTFGGAGVDASGNGTAASLDSYADLVAAASHSDRVTALRSSPYNDNLILQISDIDGQVQNIAISGGWSQYVAAGGSHGL